MGRRRTGHVVYVGGGTHIGFWLEHLVELDKLQYLNGAGYESVDWIQWAQDKQK